MKMSWRIVLIVAAALLSACVGDQKAKNGAVQLVNAVPDGPRLTLVMDGTVQASGVDYGVATGFYPRGAGSAHIAVQQIVPGATDGVVTQIDQPSALLAVNDELTIVMTNTSADPAANHVEIRNKTVAVPAGQTRLQFVHAASTSALMNEPIDVYVTDNSVTSLAGLPPLATISYKGHSERTLVTSTQSARIRLTKAGDAATVWLDSGQLTFPAEGDFIYTVVANVGPGKVAYPLVLSASSGVSSGLIGDTAVMASLRVVHGSPDTGAVDLTLQDTVTTPAPPVLRPATGLNYLSIAPAQNAYIDVPPSTYTTSFLDSTDNTKTEYSSVGDIYIRGGSYTVIFDGLHAALGRLVLGDDVRRVATEGRVRVVNAAPSASTGALDIYVVATGTVLSAQTPALTPQLAGSLVGSQTGYLSFATGDYDIIATATGSTTDIRLRQTLSVAVNQVYTAVMVEKSGGGAPLALLGLDDFP